jgi:ATP-dependent RNA helicase DeaD
MLQQIQSGKGGIQALVLAPTRELAIQVAEAISRMAQNSSVRVLAVYGGQSYRIQTRQIDRGVDVVVGTPGRLLDLIRQKVLDLSHVRYLVLDEADEMLEMGFIEDVETILAQIPGERQTALFSATLPPPIRKLADRYLSNPHQITINPTRLTVTETEQRYCLVKEENKLSVLTRILEAEEVKSALIFTRTKVRAQELADNLIQRGYSAEALHGDLTQSTREAVLRRFRRRTITLLIATDVAARGLDIEDISHVFNFDIPMDAEDYVHRIGRTGRAGRKGIAILFISPRERRRLKQIEAYTHQTIIENRIPTSAEILARRDDRFMQLLTEQLGKGSISRERAVISKLEETCFGLVEIAAAAIQLARAGESNLPIEEIFEQNTETKQKYKSKNNFDSISVSEGSKKKSRSSSQKVKGDAVPFLHGDKRPREAGMVRLWMNLGKTHGVHPSDIVGAIAGEVGIPGKAIGEIDIRKDHTYVDVSEQHAQQVVRESGGKYFMRGKPVTLRLAN